MNPGRVNRRFIFLAIGLGLLGAILVYVAFSREPDAKTTVGDGDLPVVVAKHDIPARTKITPAMLEIRLMTEEERSALSFATIEAVDGQVTRFPIAANEQVLSTKIVSLSPTSPTVSRSLSFVIPNGKRGFAVTASALQQAGGLILPGDYVDVVVIYDVEFRNRSGEPEVEDNFLVQVVVQNVEVLAVALQVVDVVPESTPVAGAHRVRNTEAPADPAAATVTLLLTPEQAQRIYMAEANGRLRMALRAFGDAEERPIDYMTELELFPQNLPNPFLR
jgi:pilus assembly protein CpaB